MNPTPHPTHPDRYAARFDALAQAGQTAVIPFILLGWPDRARCLEAVDAFVAGGATALELGLAFSDPMADGPVIQQAANEVLAAGFGVDDALALLAEIRLRHPDVPIGMLVYYNLVLARGVEKFFGDFGRAGADGVLIADLPPELMAEVHSAALAAGVALIGMVSPLTSDARLAQISRYAGGFLYVVSRLGITGTETRHDAALAELIARVHAASDLPACVGFGISRPEHARKMLAAGADGVIVGSALIELIRRTPAESLSQDVSASLQAFSAVRR